MATAVEHHIQLAQRLPPRLLTFFTKYPPSHLAPASSPSPSIPSITLSSTTSSSDPNAPATTTIPPSLSPSETISKRNHNPFLPFKNPRTGAWHAPAYSLRRQADLYKLAAHHHVLSLMPIAPKHPEVKEQKRVEKGLRVQGTGEGKKVKGKKWERMMAGKLRERERAMEGMDELIKSWKERGHGRGWKKWPK